MSVCGPTEEGLREKDIDIVAVEEDMWVRLIPSDRPGREGLSCPIVDRGVLVQSLIVCIYFLSFVMGGGDRGSNYCIILI